MNGGHGKRNGRTMGLLTNPASTCNITMIGFELGDTVYALPVPTASATSLRCWSPWSFHAFSVCHQNNARPQTARNVQELFFIHQIKLLPWLLVLSIYHQSKPSMLPGTGPGYSTRCYTRSTLAICESRMDCCTPPNNG
ncbi:hypothetical protein TNCV_3174441 [Trichonephila clavipes]|nr:hypothetical protein TNCV_3174441 [Trichonephila clavipes]